MGLSDVRDSTLLLFFMMLLIAIKVIAISNLANWTERRCLGKRLSFAKQLKHRISLWKSFYYTALVAIGCCALAGEDWIFDCRLYGLRYEIVPFIFRLYYFISIAYYLNESISIFVEPKKKDRNQMVMHHIATLLLMGISYAHGLVRYGILVLFVHDISDPFLELAKSVLALKKRRIANALFVGFMLTFFFFRLVIYPYFLVMPATKNLLQEGLRAWSITIMLMLNFLVLAHIIWGYLIVRVLWKIIMYDKADDPRSEEKGC